MDWATIAQKLLSELASMNALWVVGAAVLAILAARAIASLVKFALIAGAVLLIVFYVFSSGVLPFNGFDLNQLVAQIFH